MAERPMWQTPLREGCYMVGHRNPQALLQCNTYLRTFNTGGHKPIHWCADWGVHG
jgi:hypothetical protein